MDADFMGDQTIVSEGRKFPLHPRAAVCRDKIRKVLDSGLYPVLDDALAAMYKAGETDGYVAAKRGRITGMSGEV